MLRELIPRRSEALACLAGGILFALCLPRPGICVLAWLAPAALFFALGRARSPGAGAVLGGIFGFAFCLVSLRWIYDTCRFAGVAVPIAALAVTALGAVLADNWAVFGALARRAAILPAAARPWAWAAAWTAVESFGAHWTPRVGVDLLAYTQYRFLPLVQLGAVFGPHGLGFLVMLWNAALAELLADRGAPRRRVNMGLAALLLCSAYAYGKASLAGRREPSGELRVEILQPNIDQYQKWDESFEERIRGAFEGMLGRRRERAPDLVLWPESSLPGWLEETRNREWMSAWARRLGSKMVVGAVTSGSGRSRNAAVAVGADGTLEGFYYKRRLVPFGEFVPLRGWLEGWIGILAQMGDFDAGEPRQTLFATALGPLSASICYEAVFPHLLRQDSARGARVFANLTNDGWYKDTSGPLQHFYTNMFRAVENRVTVLRAANTGISGAIDPYGVILARTGIETQELLEVVLPAEDPFPRRSFFARHGDWFGMLAMLATAGWLLWPLGSRALRPRALA